MRGQINNLERKYLSIVINNNLTSIKPVIGLIQDKRIVQCKVESDIKAIGLYYHDFENRKLERLIYVEFDSDERREHVMEITYDREHRFCKLMIDGKMKEEWLICPFIEEMEKCCQSGQQNPVINTDELMRYREEHETKRMMRPEQLKEEIRKSIFGQDRVIDYVCDSICINLYSGNPKVSPIVFMGPTGVGKSELGRQIANALSKYSGVEYGFLKINCNEYAEQHRVSQILGSPAGYVGHGEKSALDDVKTNPYTVVVFDEIEKAHKSLLTVLLEAMDCGKLGKSDNSEPIDLNHCVVIFTSNLLVDREQYNRCSSEFEQVDLCRDVFAKHCGMPEMAGRCDFIMFNELDLNARVSIVEKFCEEAFKEYELNLVGISTPLASELVSYDSKYGARAIGKTMRQLIGRKLLTEEHKKGGKVLLTGTITNMIIETQS